MMTYDPSGHDESTLTKGESLVRWLGPAADDDVGSAMTSKVLQQNCQVYYTATI